MVGAGAFGCWAALELARRGASVRLVDPLGPGNRRSSSGGETRILRLSYGEDFHVHLAARSRVL
ncbi:MAG: FAD-dependent oxidoreductase, partial [Acidobacteriota bacterium]